MGRGRQESDGGAHDGDDVFAADRSVGYLVRDAFRAFSRALQTAIAPHGVTIGQWFFLRALWQEDGLTQRALSRRVGMMEPTTVTALNGMEKAGLIQRRRNTDDRRKINIFLTDKARALRAQALPDAMAVNAIGTAGLSEAEIETVRRLLKKMTANLQEHAATSEDRAD